MSRDNRTALAGSDVLGRLGDAAQHTEAVINPYVTAAVPTRLADATGRCPHYRHRLNYTAGRGKTRGDW